MKIVLIVSFFLGYDAVSRDTEVCTFLRNVGMRLASEAVSYAGREVHRKLSKLVNRSIDPFRLIVFRNLCILQ
jgi:hypothetical protein